jgi:hypothetical protein
VIAFHEDFGLNNRYKAGFLAEGGVAGEGVGVDVEAVIRGDTGTDVDQSAPLCEAGTEFVVLVQALAEAVQPVRHELACATGEGGGAFVYLDAGDDSLVFENSPERSAVGGVLADGFIVEDDAADEPGCPRGAEEEFAVVTAIGVCAFGADAIEAVLYGAGAFVGCRIPLPGATSARAISAKSVILFLLVVPV